MPFIANLKKLIEEVVSSVSKSSVLTVCLFVVIVVFLVPWLENQKYDGEDNYPNSRVNLKFQSL
jgi:hypothetical protein